MKICCKSSRFPCLVICLICSILSASEQAVFNWATVHDPSVIKVNDTYYLFGSHLAVAKSNDLMRWTQVNLNVYKGNPIVPDIQQDLKEAVSWARADSIWAPHVIRMPDGKFYMYYCASTFGSPRSAIGIAVSDKVEGPYRHYAVILRSGQTPADGPSEDGTPYNRMKHPNCIDPHTFYDKDGRLWMVYGSYFGGIFIIELDPNTGLPLPGQGYGERLIGGNHSPIEGPFILYSPETDYYYLFVSFGGLDSRGGYNIRVMRSRNVTGPYYDIEGNDARECMGDARTTEQFGVKLVGNFNFNETNPISAATFGYVSPGHNSAYYDPDTARYFIFFHTRFPGRGESHQIRVHQLLLNEEGWFVMAPFPYAGETILPLGKEDLLGEYMLINHGKQITSDIKQPVRIVLEDGKISGAIEGHWQLKNGYFIDISLEEKGQLVTYKGVCLKQWHPTEKKWVTTFSAVSEKGICIWGVRIED